MYIFQTKLFAYYIISNSNCIKDPQEKCIQTVKYSIFILKIFILRIGYKFSKLSIQ